jgi:alpha-galactosidase
MSSACVLVGAGGVGRLLPDAVGSSDERSMKARLRLALTAAFVSVAIGGCSSVDGPVRSFDNILFIGNSLTLHAPAPDIGWTGNWGMAASAQAKDYAHVLAAKFPAAHQTEVNLGAFETSYRTFDLGSLDSLLAARPDLVVVELGDNVADVSEYQSYYRTLIDRIESKTSAQVLCASTWFRKLVIDGAIHDACTSGGGRYVDLSPISINPVNQAGSERTFGDAGVAGHPGDRGMSAVATMLYNSLKP